MMLREKRIYVRVDDEGKPLSRSGRVDIRYKKGKSKNYRAAVGNLEAISGEAVLDDSEFGDGSAPGKSKTPSAPISTEYAGGIVAFTDGACRGNPGPAGLGVVVFSGEKRHELSEFLGRGTNNIAELTAILRAVEFATGVDAKIRVYTDSSYSIGVLSKGWKAKANVELITDIKRAISLSPGVELVYIKGHAGHEWNERADQLAVASTEARASSEWQIARA